jgi:hypothetical protein
LAGSEVGIGRRGAARLLAGISLLLAIATVVSLVASASDESVRRSDQLFLAVAGAGLTLALLAASLRVGGRRLAARRTLAAALIVLIVPAAASVAVLGFFLAALFAVVAADLLLRGRGRTWEDEAREQWAREQSGA